MLVRPVVLAVNGEHLLLAPRQILFLLVERLGARLGMVGFPRHGPLQLGVCGAQLVLVRAVVAPKSIGGCGLLDGVNDPKMGGQRKDLGFGQIRDGRQIHSTVSVFRVEAHAEVLHLVPGACHKGTRTLTQRVEGGHPEPSP